MIISHRKRFVLFTPWKAASSTLHARLAPYNADVCERFYTFNPYLNRVVHQHLTCVDFCCLPESRLGYFPASFVRNPYDRVYSAFFQVQRDLVEQPLRNYPSPWVRDLVMKQLEENLLQLRDAEFDFDHWVSLLREEQIFALGRNSSLPLHPAHYWTHAAREQIVEYIGRVENFESDFQAMCALLDLESWEHRNENTEGLSSTAHPTRYRYVERMSASSLDKINSLFAEDFSLLGYERISTAVAAESGTASARASQSLVGSARFSRIKRSALTRIASLLAAKS